MLCWIVFCLGVVGGVIKGSRIVIVVLWWGEVLCFLGLVMGFVVLVW